ncbi:hypothetical protein EV183_003729 [Coemansia sp. RSA 2336]|nr:hypothetical protein EV183_003729 [Coemansia sp. RSA 2336]
MNGISLSSRDKWLIGLSIVLPPLAIFLKFGTSRTLTKNCLFTACLIIPGIVHAIRLICLYPSVVFDSKAEREFMTRDDSVIWELPRDHFHNISHAIHVQEAQSLAVKREPTRMKSIAGFSQTPGSKSLAASENVRPGEPHYVAHMHGNAPLLNPEYGWSFPAVDLSSAAANPHVQLTSTAGSS